MIKKLLIVLAVVVLFVAPIVGRWLYYNQGVYRAGEVPRPDLSRVAAPTPEMPAFADRPTPAAAQATPGTVLVDQAHDNRFQKSELSVLQARLAARGLRLETVESVDNLAGQLRYARSLVVISPGSTPAAGDVQAIKEFVAKGGRLLLVGDPTRFQVLLDDYGNYSGLDSDASHLNDLAAQFGLVFQSDYLYNTVQNEGNFRNIRLTEFATDTLTAGLKQVVFYAAHSVVASDRALISAAGDTRSSSSERAGALPVAALGAGGSVLALGDLTFMTEPYNVSYDNDRLVSNIAGFLSGARRTYELADFPFFFRDAVDLVYAGDPLLDADLLKGGSTLQALFISQGKTLNVSQAEDLSHDTLFFGLYREAGDVQPYLAQAGVTLIVTPTEEAAAAKGDALSVTPTAPLTITPGLAPAAGTGVTTTAVVSPAPGGRADVQAVGQVVLSGTAVLMLQTAGERHVLVVLASTETGLDNAVQRLAGGKMEYCVLRQVEVTTPTILALCPTGEVAAGKGPGGWQDEKRLSPAPAPTSTLTTTLPISQPVSAPKGDITVIAMDKGKGRYDSRSDAQDYAAVLEREYNVAIWSEAKDGTPPADKLAAADLVVWAAGDFESPFGEQETATLMGLMLAETPTIISGAYFNQDSKDAVQRDLKVRDTEHAIMKGFTTGQVIDLLPSPSGKEYAMNIVDTGEGDGATVMFVRGPKSESPGAPSVVLLEESSAALRFLYIGLPIYLLPDDVKSGLVRNAVAWMLSN